MIKVSIITPAYNAEKYIERCIDSVLRQSLAEIEHIIVDDGSKDKTGIICDEYKDKDDRIIVIHKKNEGVSKARNAALKIAKGKYVLFADADDWLEPDMCKEMFETAENNNDDIVISEYKNYYENKNIFENINLIEYDDASFTELICEDGNGYGGFPWNKLVKRKKINRNFDEDIHYYENLLFFLENFDKNTKFSVIHKALYNYCINDNSAVHSKKFNIKKISALKALEKVIPLLPNEFVDQHKMVYLSNYFVCWCGLKKEKIDKDYLKAHKSIYKKYYKEIILSSGIRFENKLKYFLIFRFPNICYFIKRIKSK